MFSFENHLSLIVDLNVIDEELDDIYQNIFIEKESGVLTPLKRKHSLGITDA